jgi:hypothetical protein
MVINHSLIESIITKIVKIALHLNFIEIYGNFLKSSPEKVTEMRYNILARFDNMHNSTKKHFSISSAPVQSRGESLVSDKLKNDLLRLKDTGSIQRFKSYL